MYSLLKFCSLFGAKILRVHENKSHRVQAYQKPRAVQHWALSIHQAQQRHLRGQQGGLSAHKCSRALSVPRGRGHHTTLQWPAIVSLNPAENSGPAMEGHVLPSLRLSFAQRRSAVIPLHKKKEAPGHLAGSVVDHETLDLSGS